MKHLRALSLFLMLVTGSAAFAGIKFVPLRQAPAGQDGEYFMYRPDAARVESSAPLTVGDRQGISAALLKGYTQEQLDQLYFRLGSGPIPTGDFNGTILVKNTLVQAIEGKLIDSFTSQGLISGLVRKAILKFLCQSQDGLECIGGYLWKGKHFYPPAADGGVELRNAIPMFVRDPIGLRLANLEGFIAPLQKARVDKFNGSDFMMLFPANVYCGISLIDARRESIVIDYAYGDDYKPFIPEVDGIAGRDGKGIRDEIRMVKPGLYLGRAYADKIFLLNFVLEAARPSAQDWSNRCWSGNSWQ
jgi:hypothetical protein